ncbi:MAG: hypothetical protein AAGD01_20150 [Acidobacteriota bacterium]
MEKSRQTAQVDSRRLSKSLRGAAGASPQATLPFAETGVEQLRDEDAEAVRCRASVRYLESSQLSGVSGRLGAARRAAWSALLRRVAGGHRGHGIADGGFGAARGGQLFSSSTIGCHWTLDTYRGDEFAPAYTHARYRQGGAVGGWREAARGIRATAGSSSVVSSAGSEQSRSFDERTVIALDQLPQRLRQLISRQGHRAMEGGLALGFEADPYQSAERRYGVTRQILEILAAQQEGMRLVISTRSPLILRDLDLLVRLNQHSALEVRMLFPCAGDELGRTLEPTAPLPSARWRTVEKLAERGLEVTVCLTPLLPAINAGSIEVRNLARRASEAGAYRLDAQSLVLKGAERLTFFRWMGETFAEELALYRGQYGWKDQLSPQRRKALQATFEHHCHRYDLRLAGSRWVIPSGEGAVFRQAQPVRRQARPMGKKVGRPGSRQVKRDDPIQNPQRRPEEVAKVETAA